MKERIQLICLALFFVSLPTGPAKAEVTVDQVAEFLETNVINRTVSREGGETIDNDSVAAKFQSNMTFCNLVRHPNSVSFDVVAVVKQKNQDLDGDGNPVGEPRVKDRVLVFRNTLGRKNSTGAVLGYQRIISATTDNWRGFAAEYGVKMDGDAMVTTTKTVGYDDFFGQGGEDYAGRSEAIQKYHAVNGKLVIEFLRLKTERIDEQTGKVQSVKMEDLPGDFNEIANLNQN